MKIDVFADKKGFLAKYLQVVSVRYPAILDDSSKLVVIGFKPTCLYSVMTNDCLVVYNTNC